MRTRKSLWIFKVRKIIVFTFYVRGTIPVAPMSIQPAIIFRLEMAQPFYVIAQVACAASSRAFVAKYRHRGGMQLYLIIACFHWKPGYVLPATFITCCSFFRKCPDVTKLKRARWADYRTAGEQFPCSLCLRNVACVPRVTPGAVQICAQLITTN